LKLPDKSLGAIELRKCFNRWLTATPIGNSNNRYPALVTWVLEDDYDTFDNIHGTDRERANMLLQAAKDHGFKCYYVTLTVEEIGYADSHEDYDDSDEDGYYPAHVR
jgi:hypothetical protein